MTARSGEDIRIAMLGMVEGNGHPYSWSAIINGEYDAQTMADCGYPVIPEYLGAQPAGALGIAGARVTHVACDDYEDARHVAKAACIPNVVREPAAVIGEVDAVIVATDIGEEHVDRARPFIDAGLPVFIDKPLADRADDLKQFMQWHRDGKRLLSTSCMRYAAEFAALRRRLDEIGEPCLITVTMAKSWERYGIHALEAVYPFLPAGGYETVTHSGDNRRNIVHLTHKTGVDIVLAVIQDLTGAFGHVSVYADAGADHAVFSDTFTAFKTQLEAFVEYVRTDILPFPFEETVEQMTIIIAGMLSRERGGQTVHLTEVLE